MLGRFLTLTLIVGFPVISLAEDIFDLSLEDLMKVKVVSGKEESILDSPGTVSTYYPHQLEGMGLHSLSEIISFATSSQLNDSISSVEVIQLRGLSDSNNQKILFLLDGIPYWMPSHGHIPINGIPFSAIEKIEVIRGPAGVIYGTNSSSGVINVVTRKSSGQSISVMAGEDNLGNVDLFASHQFEEGYATFSFAKQQHDGFEAEVFNTFTAFDSSCFCFPVDEESTFKNRKEFTSALSQLRYSNFDVTLQAYTSERNDLANASVLTPAVRMQEGQLISARYNKTLGDHDFSLYSHWNRFYWESEIDDFLSLFGISGDGSIEFDNNGANNIRWLQGIKYNHQLNDAISLLMGAEYEDRSSENNKFKDTVGGAGLTQLTQPPFNRPFEIQPDGSIILIEEANITEVSTFFQGEYVTDDWRYVLGLRHVNNDESGSYTAPRLSAVWSYQEDQSIKILYGEGFNSPTFRQTGGRDQLGIKRTNDVDAEIIKTYEVAWLQSHNTYHQTATLYHAQSDNLITEGSEGITNSNDTVTRNGAEYEFTYSKGTWDALMSLSYLHQGNQVIKYDNTSIYTSKWLGRLGLVKRFSEHSFGISLRSSSKRYLVDEQHLLNFHYQIRYENYTGFVTLNNVTNENVYHPDVRQQQDAIVQAEKETSFKAGLQVTF